MTECKNCRGLMVCRYGYTRGYISEPTEYGCALGHTVCVSDNKIICKDFEICKDKTTRKKVLTL